MNLGCLSLEQRKELAVNLRGSYRWSQQKIADAIGVDQKTVCNWLGGAAEAPHSYAYIVKYGVGSPILHRFTGVPDSTIKAAMVALGPTAREKRMLDGRNRLAACKLAGVKPRFIQYTGDSPVAFIVAANLKRRHLDKGQKIALALEIEPLFAEEARKRMAAGGGDHGNQYTGGKPGVGKSPTPAKSRNQPQSQKVGNVPPLEKAKARDQAAVAVPVPPPCAALPQPWPPPPVVLYLYTKPLDVVFDPFGGADHTGPAVTAAMNLPHAQGSAPG